MLVAPSLSPFNFWQYTWTIFDFINFGIFNGLSKCSPEMSGLGPSDSLVTPKEFLSKSENIRGGSSFQSDQTSLD